MTIFGAGEHTIHELGSGPEADCDDSGGPAPATESSTVFGRLRRHFDQLLVRILGDEADRLDPVAATPPTGRSRRRPTVVASAVAPAGVELTELETAHAHDSSPEPERAATRPARRRNPPRHAAPSPRLAAKFASKDNDRPKSVDPARAAP